MTIRESAGNGNAVALGAGIVEPPQREPFLVALGERVRSLRARKGMTRRSLAIASSVSERLLIRDLIHGRSDQDLRRARLALAELFGTSSRPEARMQRIALIGLRGAGKSTLGHRLADDMGVPFVELNREIERVAGYGLSEIHNLLGPAAYRRYERRALEEVVQLHPEAVIATPGGIVSDPATFNLLLSHCYTVWLKAAPSEHMQRVMAQGDTRPMAGHAEAMDDLKRILTGRAAFYGKADLIFDTSGQPIEACYDALATALSQAIGRPIGLGTGEMQ